MSLKGKKIIVAVTGSIAAYKIPQLVRLLVKAGAEVQVLMTQAATSFVTPLTLATVSKRQVYADVHNGAEWNNHVHLGLWADAMVITPCTANTLAKLAGGACDNLVNAVYLSARCPVFIAPAMDEDMWRHPSVKSNVQRVQSFGNHLLPIGHGELASGLTGDGRMAEPEEIATHLDAFFSVSSSLAGKTALITAGPTYEKIDPVRFIGNFSTGKMGIAIAEELAGRGAEVHLVCGPTTVTSNSSVIRYNVESAAQMYDKCLEIFPECDVAIMAAAVADYRPEVQATEKIKKADDALVLNLVKNNDILATLGKIKRAGQTLVGFALETGNELAHATEKLVRKNADIIVLNSLNDAGAGFGHDTNKVTVLAAGGTITPLPLADKKEVARLLVDMIKERIDA